MHLKRYRRPTLKDALRAVREELGPDALVLSTREVTAQGMRGMIGGREIEVTAAAERQVVPDSRHVAARARNEPVAVAPPRRSRSDRAIDQIAARLEAGGLSADLARDIAMSHPVGRRRGADTESLKETLARELTTIAAGEEPYAAIEAFVGPPGVGKTTTIAKIAAQERARQGQRLTLLAADGFRVGAIEQLRLYADILGAPFVAARTSDEFARALDGSKHPLLVDTAGRSPSDDVSKDMFRLLASRHDVRTHLVIPAATTARAAERLIDRFADAQPTRVVLTRLDEAETIGPLVSVLRARRLPFSFFGTGQNVPADLQRVTAPVLADWVMGEMVQGAVA
jgi:flagellar biosynthesis protein FlhF